jgi:putative glutamine amidotransferase
VTATVGLVAATEDVDSVAYAAVRYRYVHALAEVAGCDVMVLTGPVRDPAGYLARLDGLVLGGHQSNVDPARYGGTPRPGGHHDPVRDSTALSLLPPAVAAGVPVLGICRGLQELNVALGGTLRDLRPGPAGIEHHEDTALPRDEQYAPVHDVRVTPGGVLDRILGARTVRVNSLHGQAVGRPAAGLQVEAVAGDGVIEAASVPGTPALCLAVQWHPEWFASADPVSKALFTAFGAAAARRAEGRRD